MVITPDATRGTRVKACTECRQQKLRCDASENYSKPCSRCRRFGLSCVVTKNFRRVKKRTKTELQAELDALKQQVQGGSASSEPPEQRNSAPSLPTKSTSLNEPSSYLDIMSSIGPQTTTESSMSLPMNIAPRQTSNATTIPPTHGSMSQPPMPRSTLARSIGDHTVDAQDIDDCFHIFMQYHLPHLPALDSSLRPNDCFTQSQFLFWTIVAVGSRRYTQDPTLIISLAPEVNSMAIKAVFAFETSPHTIIACLLLCTWPMPFDSLSKDITPVLAGAVLQRAMNMGLHVYGVGQDFSRTKIQADRTQRDFRARLWALTIITCQRSSASRGIPPSAIPDTYMHESYRADATLALSQSTRFQKDLNRILTEETLRIENDALSKLPPNRAMILGPMIDTAFSRLVQLEAECPEMLDKFYLLTGQMQLLTLHLFLPQSDIESTKLQQLYDTACNTIDLSMELDRTQNFSEYASIFVSIYLNLAAFLILRIGRCHVRDAVDLTRGRKSYFSVIQFHKKMSVRPEDVAARSTVILTQLYTSKNIFRRSDGTTNSLLLRCRSRLGMSVLYDCYWWWRQEFAGQPDPYEGVDDKGTRATTPSFGPIRTPGAESGSYTGVGWSPQMMFPDFQWPMMDDIMDENWANISLDLDPQLQNFDPLQPDMLGGTSNFAVS